MKSARQYIETGFDDEKKRTEKQNNSLHLFFKQVADALNEAGLDMRATLAPEVEIAWSGASVKEYLWRPIQTLQLQKRSTTELDTTDIDILYATINEFLAKHGIHVEFPSEETLSEE